MGGLFTYTVKLLTILLIGTSYSKSMLMLDYCDYTVTELQNIYVSQTVHITGRQTGQPEFARSP